MIRTGNLYEKICSFENIYSAYLKARKCKRYRPGVLDFTENLEHNLLSIWHDLRDKTYAIGPYKTFIIFEPKEREIFALEFRDRVVQHALIAVIDPVISSTFIHDTYACRTNKGTHAGLRRLHQLITNCSGENYFLKADISKYFPSIDKEILKEKIRRKIKCADTLWLIDQIIDSSSAGLPIGNLTSQLFANFYLSDLDHFIKEQLLEKRYLRYMDDFVIIGSDLEKLKQDRAAIQGELEKIGLYLNSKTAIAKIKQGIDFLGYRNWPNITKLRKRNIIKNRRKFNKFAKRITIGKTNETVMERSAASLHGYTKYAACEKTKFSILKGVTDVAKIKV